MPELARWILICIVALSTQAKAFADHPDWQESKALYESKKYEEALHSIQALQAPQDTVEDANYYYNLGTLYFRLGRLGLAIGNLEKANRLQPHDPDIEFNLSIVRTALNRKIGTEKMDPVSGWTESIADSFTLDEVRTVLGILGIAILLLAIQAYLTTRNIKKALMTPAGWISIVCLTIAIGVESAHRWVNTSPPAVSLEKQVVRSGPGNHYVELAQIEEGSKIRVLGPTASSNATETSPPEIWRQIRYSTSGIGWVRASSLLTL